MSTLIANNEEVDFVVRNYQAVQALLDTYQIARAKLPVWLARRLDEKCRDAEGLTDALGMVWEIGHNDSEVWCKPEKFNFRDQVWCLYYGFENFGWDALVTGEGGDDCPWIYLYFMYPARPQKHQVEWKENVLNVAAKEKVRLSRKGYNVLPDKNDNYLVKRFIGRTLNLYEIADDPAGVIDRIVELLLQTVKDTKVLLIGE